MPLTTTTWDYAATREAPGRARHAVSDFARECGMRDRPLGALALVGFGVALYITGGAILTTKDKEESPPRGETDPIA